MTPIPFESQQTIDGSRTCGAAALAMVYRSLGLTCQQPAIWQRVAEEIRPGVKAARTHRLALDACQQGLAAVTLQARQPARLLAELLAGGIRVILNHRLDPHSGLGHYSVLLGFDGRQIAIHDPHNGPGRVLPWTELADLWGPGEGLSEVVGWILVAVGRMPDDDGCCSRCGKRLPDRWTCAGCGQAASTGPRGVVGCCADALWGRLFCPHCDLAMVHRGR